MNAKINGVERTTEEIIGADNFRKSILSRADAYDGPAPLWHGWALVDGFFAGMDYARKEKRK